MTLEGLTALGAAVASRTALLDAASRHLDDQALRSVFAAVFGDCQALDHLRERWRDACPAGHMIYAVLYICSRVSCRPLPHGMVQGGA